MPSLCPTCNRYLAICTCIKPYEHSRTIVVTTACCEQRMSYNTVRPPKTCPHCGGCWYVTVNGD